MNLQRTLTLSVALGAIAVWIAGAATSNPSQIVQLPPPTNQPIEASGAELASEVARLRERLRPTATPLGKRDLFRYRAESGTSRPELDPGAASLAAPVAETAPVPVMPSFAFVGLAEDVGPDGPIRTAIISGGGDLFVVKEGDPVTDRYQVTRISADVVELMDRTTATPLRLALR